MLAGIHFDMIFTLYLWFWYHTRTGRQSINQNRTFLCVVINQKIGAAFTFEINALIPLRKE